MKKFNISIIVVLLCLIVGTVLCIQSIIGRDTAETPPPQAPTPSPVETPVLPPEKTPEPTPTPKPIPKPTPTPTPTPKPTPTPYKPPAVRSGSFRSDTGTGLNLLVEWSAYALSGNYQVDVAVSALSYGFYTDALYDSITITVGGKSVVVSSPKVSYDGDELVTTPLVSHSLDADPGIVPISVVWNYKGSYSGVELESITASGTADLS